MASSPCATCPWLRQNQTKAARKTSPIAEGAFGLKWYAVANLRRMWRGYQTGYPTLCHSTDPAAAEYGGKAAKDGAQRTCVGGLILTARAMDVVNARARARPSTLKATGIKSIWHGLFTRAGLIYWVEAPDVSRYRPGAIYQADTDRVRRRCSARGTRAVGQRHSQHWRTCAARLTQHWRPSDGE